MPLVGTGTATTPSLRSRPYTQPRTPIGATYRNFNNPHKSSLRPDSRFVLVPGGCDAGDTFRNSDAKLSIRGINTPIQYIFFAGGHGIAVDNGIIDPTEAQYALPACTTIFPNYLGEKAVSGVSKHTIVANLTALITSKQQQQGRFRQGDFLDILETEDVQQIGGCPAITVHRQNPIEMMHNLYMFGTGGIHSEDFLNAGTRNPSCLYMIDITTGTYQDLSTMLCDKIIGWRKEVEKAVADWNIANPSDTSSGAEKMRKINAANPNLSPTPPQAHYVKKSDGSRITLADVTDLIKTKMSELGASPEQCLLYVIACRRCDTSCNYPCRVMSSNGGKTKKRRRRNRPRSARYRSRQVRRRTRTKRTKRK